MAREGEIVGLAGLAGHGQTELLLAAFDRRLAAAPGAMVDGPVALVAGDRVSDGVFPHMVDRAEHRRALAEKPARRPARLAALEGALAESLATSGSASARPTSTINILSLSGGNQQKALFARALASDARIVLMDDPMRGVDFGTKLEVYELIRAEAAAGRTFLWYTTETEELKNCDRVYVFRNGAVVAELTRDELSEERVIHSSFAEVA